MIWIWSPPSMVALAICHSSVLQFPNQYIYFKVFVCTFRCSDSDWYRIIWIREKEQNHIYICRPLTIGICWRNFSLAFNATSSTHFRFVTCSFSNYREIQLRIFSVQTPYIFKRTWIDKASPIVSNLNWMVCDVVYCHLGTSASTYPLNCERHKRKKWIHSNIFEM